MKAITDLLNNQETKRYQIERVANTRDTWSLKDTDTDEEVYISISKTAQRILKGYLDQLGANL